MTVPTTGRDLQPAQLHPEVSSGMRASPDLSTSSASSIPSTPSSSTIEVPATPSTIGVLLISADEPLPPARRLIVLVPDMDVDESGLAARIWALASPHGLEVLFLGTLREEQNEFRARRRLATLAAITRDNQVQVEFTVMAHSHWVRAVQGIWRPGDLVVCHAEQTAAARGWRHQPLSQALITALDAPVCILSGFYPKLPSERPNWLVQILAWLPPLAIIVVFFILQVRITQGTAGWVQTALLCLSVFAEFGLIAAWEHFLGHVN